MAKEFEILDVWVGRFANAKHFERFFAERYADDARPISAFARSQDANFYDHDFLERSYVRLGTALRERLLEHSFGRSYADAAAKAHAAVGSPRFNAVVLLWNRQIAEPRSVKRRALQLTWLGTFPCKPK